MAEDPVFEPEAALEFLRTAKWMTPEMAQMLGL